MHEAWNSKRDYVQEYKSYKAEKFEKTKQRVLNILNGVDQLSLKPADKKKLIEEIKKIVANF